jgi:hypothetical protein
MIIFDFLLGAALACAPAGVDIAPAMQAERPGRPIRSITLTIGRRDDRIVVRCLVAGTPVATAGATGFLNLFRHGRRVTLGLEPGGRGEMRTRTAVGIASGTSVHVAVTLADKRSAEAMLTIE